MYPSRAPVMRILPVGLAASYAQAGHLEKARATTRGPCRQTMMIDHPLKSERLFLLPPAPEDAPALLEAMQSSLAEISAWATVTDGLATPHGVRQLISRARRRMEDGTHLYWRLWTQLSLCLIGSVSVHTIDREAGSAELGYWLRKTATGDGYATEACHRVLQFLFELPEFAHIAVRCDSRNERALGVARRLEARWPCRHEIVAHAGRASTTEVFRFSSDISVRPGRPGTTILVIVGKEGDHAPDKASRSA